MPRDAVKCAVEDARTHTGIHIWSGKLEVEVELCDVYAVSRAQSPSPSPSQPLPQDVVMKFFTSSALATWRLAVAAAATKIKTSSDVNCWPKRPRKTEECLRNINKHWWRLWLWATGRLSRTAQHSMLQQLTGKFNGQGYATDNNNCVPHAAAGNNMRCRLDCRCFSLHLSHSLGLSLSLSQT